MDTETIQLIISTIGLFGIGGIVGAYIQHLFEKQNQIGLEIRKITENRYRSTLIFMRCFLKPNITKQFQIDDPSFPFNASESEKKDYAINKIIEFYYNSLLYASDDVLFCIKKFIRNPSEHAFIETAIAMRYDIWAIDNPHNEKGLALSDGID